MTTLTIGKSSNGMPDWGIEFAPGKIISMAALTQYSMDLPYGTQRVLIQVQSGATVLIGPNESEAENPASTWEDTSVDINPAMRIVNVNFIPTLYFFAIDAAIVVIKFFKDE